MDHLLQARHAHLTLPLFLRTVTRNSSVLHHDAQARRTPIAGEVGEAKVDPGASGLSVLSRAASFSFLSSLLLFLPNAHVNDSYIGPGPVHPSTMSVSIGRENRYIRAVAGIFFMIVCGGSYERHFLYMPFRESLVLKLKSELEKMSNRPHRRALGLTSLATTGGVSNRTHSPTMSSDVDPFTVDRRNRGNNYITLHPAIGCSIASTWMANSDAPIIFTIYLAAPVAIGARWSRCTFALFQMMTLENAKSQNIGPQLGRNLSAFEYRLNSTDNFLTPYGIPHQRQRDTKMISQVWGHFKTPYRVCHVRCIIPLL